MAGGKRPGAGRPKTRPQTVRKHFSGSGEVWDFLSRNGNPSAEIERLARNEMNKKFFAVFCDGETLAFRNRDKAVEAQARADDSGPIREIIGEIDEHDNVYDSDDGAWIRVIE